MNMSASKHQNFNINSYVMLESSTNTTILIGGSFQNHCASANPFLRVFLYRYLTQSQYYQHDHGSINGDNKISIGFSSQLKKDASMTYLSDHSCKHGFLVYKVILLTKEQLILSGPRGPDWVRTFGVEVASHDHIRKAALLENLTKTLWHPQVWQG